MVSGLYWKTITSTIVLVTGSSWTRPPRSSFGGGVRHRDGGYPELGGLPGEQARVAAARCQRGDPEPPRVAPHDVQRHGLVGVATKASDFEIEITCVERVTKRR